MTRGHNIVVDGWVGECNPHPHDTHIQTHRQSQLQHKKCAFLHVLTQSSRTNGRTDRPMDGWTKPPTDLRVCNFKQYSLNNFDEHIIS